MNVMRERRLRGAIPTQREVAKAVGVKESAVSKWERGIAKPRADKLPKLAELYGGTENGFCESGTRAAFIIGKHRSTARLIKASTIFGRRKAAAWR